MSTNLKYILIGLWAALLLACKVSAAESLTLGVYPSNGAEPGVVLSKVMMNSTNAGFISLEFKLSFDPAKAVLLGYESGAQAKGMTVAVNTNQPGVLYVAFAGPNAVSGYGSLLQVSFKSTSLPAATLSDAQANEGSLTVAVDSNQFYPPAKPGLASPVSLSIITNTTVVLDWTSNSMPAVFDVYFDTNSQPSALIASNLTLSECLSPALGKGTTYYWQVAARNPLGEVKSDVFAFSTKAVPVAKPQNIELKEDLSIAIDLSGTDADGATLTYAVTVLPTNGVLSGIAPKLTYRPAANYYGADGIEFKVNNGFYDSIPVRIAINVMPVNDAPTFVKGADQTVNEDAGPQTLKGWGTALSTGAANESGQVLAFEVSNDNASLFLQPPAISMDGTLSYTTATNANGKATVTVVLKDDGGTANGGVDRSAAQTFTITANAVNDAPSFVKGADQSINEDGGAQMVKGWAADISTGPAHESSQTVQFDVTNDNPALFQQAPAISADGALSYTPAANASGKAIVTVVLKDDGGVANGGTDRSVAQTFVISVSAINDAPTFVKGADQVVNEDAGPQLVKGWATAISAGAANESGQALAFEVSHDNASLFLSPPVIGLDGTLNYTTATNANGKATVTVVLKDDGGTVNGGVDRSAAQTFTITANAVNDAPSFVKGADQSINEDGGPQMVKGWATGISAGPANESSQTVQFDVTNDNPALFQQAPAISADGALSYTPAANASGKAIVTVVLKDDGGVVNGGTDRNVAQTFVISVNAINDAPSFVKGADQVANEDAGPQMVKGWAMAISAGAANESGQALVFEVSNDNASLFLQPPAIGVDGTLNYTTATNANGKATVTVVFKDDGGTANGGVDRSAAQSFTITVNAVNDAPSFVKGADQSINEDAGSRVVRGWATAIASGHPGETGHVLKFELSNDNPSLFQQQPAISPEGMLSFTTAADSNGLAVVTVTLLDDGTAAGAGVDRSAAQTFRITINPVNDAPSFVKGPDQTINEGSGVQSVKSWATVLSVGPANESGQSASFEVVNDNPGLFQQPPSIASDGTLSYTPAAGVSGKANVTVVMQDSGGSANGGVDRGIAQTFSIVVSPALKEIRISGFTRKNGVSRISWSSTNGRQYLVQYRDDLRSGLWNNLDGEVAATGGLASKDDATPSAGKRFYRVLGK